MVNGRIVREDDASLIPWIDANGFDSFERGAAAADEVDRPAAASIPVNLGAGMSQSLRSVLDAEGPTCDAKNAQ